MKAFSLVFLFVCATLNSVAQTNFVKNPDFELYSKCPDDINNIVYATYWTNVIDTVSTNLYQPEYYNACGNTYPDVGFHIPANTAFYQYPHSDSGMAGTHFYYDNPPPLVLYHLIIAIICKAGFIKPLQWAKPIVYLFG